MKTRLLMTGRLSILHIRYAEGYNAVSRALLRRRFGWDILEECFEETLHPVVREPGALPGPTPLPLFPPSFLPPLGEG